MDAQTLWIIALSISTPVAGVVGFAIQLREVKKKRLENVKLQLEIEELRANAAAADRRIVQVTTEEVQRFSTRDVMFSRRSTAEVAAPRALQKPALKDYALVGAVVLSVALLLAYFVYDLYRLFVWVSARF